MNDFLRAFRMLFDQFLWSSHSVTRTAPHIRDANNVQRMWNYFVIASLPALIIGLWSLGHQTNLALHDFQLMPEEIPGWRAQFLAWSGIGFDAHNILASLMHGLLYFIPVFTTALLVGAFWEALFANLRKRPVDEGLLAMAWLFAMLLPATVSMYQVALGMSFGIVVGKLIYGGSGRYLVNPALLALTFLVFSYPQLLFSEGAWVPVPGYDQPTVLELITDEGGLSVVAAVDYSYWNLFFGDRPGSMGGVSGFGALLGAAFLVWSGMASWRIILGALLGLVGVSLLCNAIAPNHELFSLPWYWHAILGGFVFATVFLATDPVAGPMTDPGRWGFGLLVGGLTVIIRVGNPSHYEGILFAILLASLFSPMIDYIVTELNIRRRRLRLQEVDHEQ
jgi:Na+-transporting NADH:ubiquinone oxidoreductase subunit B